MPPGPSPRAPGAPPWGGVGTLKSADRSVVSPLGFRIEIYDDFDVDFGSFWGRSWVPLGGHFRSFWRLGRPKLVPEPSSNHLIFEKVILHEIVRFPTLLGPRAPTLHPQRGQDRSKIGSLIVLDRLFSTFDFRFDLGSFSVPFVILVPGPCGLRAARLSPPPPEGSERVQTVFELVFRILRTQRV